MSAKLNKLAIEKQIILILESHENQSDEDFCKVILNACEIITDQIKLNSSTEEMHFLIPKFGSMKLFNEDIKYIVIKSCELIFKNKGDENKYKTLYSCWLFLSFLMDGGVNSKCNEVAK